MEGFIMPGWGIALIIVGVVLFILLVWWVSTGNKFKVMAVKIDEAESGIDVALTKRYDLLTKAIATVKGYAKHEKETFNEIVSLRSNSYDSMSPKEKIEANNKLSQNLTKLFAGEADHLPCLGIFCEVIYVHARNPEASARF